MNLFSQKFLGKVLLNLRDLAKQGTVADLLNFKNLVNLLAKYNHLKSLKKTWKVLTIKLFIGNFN